MQFQHFLAHELGMTVADLVETMDVVEYARWGRYFMLKHRQEKEAIDSAKRSRRR